MTFVDNDWPANNGGATVKTSHPLGFALLASPKGPTPGSSHAMAGFEV